MKETTKQFLITGIVAGVLGASVPSFGDDVMGKCKGANTCGVEGKNSCAGEGEIETTKAKCMMTKQEWLKSTDEKKKAQAKKIKWEAIKS
jgi:hypothetical protein